MKLMQPYIIVRPATEEIVMAGRTKDATTAFAKEADLPEGQMVHLTAEPLDRPGRHWWDAENEVVMPRSELPEIVTSGPAPFLLDVSQYPEGSDIRVKNEAGDRVVTTPEDPPVFHDVGEYSVRVEPGGNRHNRTAFIVTVTEAEEAG